MPSNQRLCGNPCAGTGAQRKRSHLGAPPVGLAKIARPDTNDLGQVGYLCRWQVTAIESPHDLSQAERRNALFLCQTAALQPPTNLIGAPSFNGELVDEQFPPEQRRGDVRQVGEIDRQAETFDIGQGRIVPFHAVWNPTRPINDIADNAAGECVEQPHVHR